MTASRSGRMVLIAIVAAVSMVAACGSGAPSPTPAASSSGSSGPVATSTASPTASTASPVAIATPVGSSGPATPAPSACPPLPQTVELPSDRLTDLRVATSGEADRLTFVFGDPSLPGPAGHPVGTLELASPPYTMAGSGAPVAVAGQHVVGVRFTAMSIANDAGEETYGGPRGLEETLPALRGAVLYDEFEGSLGWYVGYDGPGCPTLAATGRDITLTIDHP